MKIEDAIAVLQRLVDVKGPVVISDKFAPVAAMLFNAYLIGSGGKMAGAEDNRSYSIDADTGPALTLLNSSVVTYWQDVHPMHTNTAKKLAVLGLLESRVVVIKRKAGTANADSPMMQVRRIDPFTSELRALVKDLNPSDWVTIPDHVTIAQLNTLLEVGAIEVNSALNWRKL